MTVPERGQPADAASSADADLDRLRRRIDGLDQQIASLLQERAALSLEVGRAKGGGDTAPIFVPDREAAVLQRVQAVPGPLGPQALANVYREILAASRSLQRQIRVAHLGPLATFGHQAALLKFGGAAAFEPTSTNAEVFTVVERGGADYGMAPFENSTEGGVGEVLDRLVDTPLQVCAEVIVPVSHALMSRSTDLKGIVTVLSHPQASGQCRGWLSQHLHGVPVEASVSTARAAELAVLNPKIGAIAPRLAAEVYGLNVLADNIQDLAGNVTRFLVLANAPSAKATGHDRTMVIFSIRDRVGALRDLTDAFASNGVNMSSIQSRPSKRRAWDYVFFIELDGHLSEERVQKSIDQAREHTVFFKVAGSWPSAG